MTLLDIIKPSGSVSEGTAKNINSLKNFIKTFLKEELKVKDYPLKKITQDFWRKFQEYSLLHHSPNTIVVQVSMINGFINLLPEGSAVPLIKRIVDKVAPEENALCRTDVWRIELYKKDEVCIERDMFLFQCETGIAYDDMQRITKKNIVEVEEGLILRYKRGKTKDSTGAVARVPLSDKAYSILVNHGFSLKMKYWTYLRRLEDMGKALELSITSHTGRHTFGSLMTEDGCDHHILGTYMAHSSSETTKRYTRPTNTALFNNFPNAKKVNPFLT